MALCTFSSSIRFLRLHPFPPSHTSQPLVSSELLSPFGRLWWFFSGHPTALLSPQPRLLILLLGPRQCLSVIPSAAVPLLLSEPSTPFSSPLTATLLLLSARPLFCSLCLESFPASPTPALSLAPPPAGGLSEVPTPLSHVQSCILCVFL